MGVTGQLVDGRGSLVRLLSMLLLAMCATACSADLSTEVLSDASEPQALPAVRSDSMIFGINGHPLMQTAYLLDGRTANEQFDYLDSLRIRWYRVDVMPDSDGALGPSFSQLMQTAARRNIHVLPVITNRPRSGQTPEEAYAEALRMGKGFASRYGQLFTHVEAGNELEGWPLWSGSKGSGDGSDLSQYDADTLAVVTAWLRGLTRGLRWGAPKLRLIIDTGGWHHWAFFDALRSDTVDYDIVGYHWYSEMGDIDAPVAQGKSTIDFLYDLNKDIWITEINSRAKVPGDPRDQAYWLSRYVRDFYRLERVKAFFVYELYEERVFLGDDKPKNDSEAFYGLVSCPADPVGCAGEKVTKPAFDAYRFAIEEQSHGHEDYVKSLYVHLLGREPDPGELVHWTSVLKRSNDKWALLRELMQAGDYYEQIVRKQYGRLLEYDSQNANPPGAGDVTQWADRMRAGLSRRELMLEMCESSEFLAASGGTNEGYVQRLHRTLLGRDASADELAHWVEELNGGATRRDIAAQLLDSDEYHALFVDALYRTLLESEPDSRGRDQWVARMRDGTSQETVILSFLQSREFWSAAVEAGYRSR